MMQPLRWNLLGILCAGSLALAGCRMPWTTYLVLPARYNVVREQLVIHSDSPIPANHRLLEELTARRGDLQEQLGLPPSDEPIHVYLFDSPEEFRRFVSLHHPDFPTRRAFFLETDTRLQVYAQWGDRVAEDLRHEVTHGYLHSALPNLPLWLDEGLAEYAEAPRGNRGLNASHLALLRQRRMKTGWQPDLVRLEGLDPARDMTQEDYAESWAWVHFLLETGEENRGILREFLAAMRQSGSAVPISQRLRERFGQPEQILLAHLGSLAPDSTEKSVAARPEFPLQAGPAFVPGMPSSSGSGNL
jgi:hypothetical protein